MGKIKFASIPAGILAATILAGNVFVPAAAESVNSTYSTGKKSASATQYIDNSSLIPEIADETNVQYIGGTGAENTTPDWVSSLIITEVNVATASTDGKFSGMTKALNHLAEAGINGIWVTPVYDVTDNDSGYLNYGPDTVNRTLTGVEESADPNYENSWEVVKSFVDEAHSRNIRVFFDITTWGVSDDCSKVSNSGLADWFTSNDPYYVGGKNYNWENKSLRNWFKKQMISIIKKTGADGFRADGGSQYASSSFFKEVKEELASTKKIAIFSECAEARDGTFDFEEHTVNNIGATAENPTGKGDPFDNTADFYTEKNIVEAVKNGTNLGTDSLLAASEGGKGRFYSSLLSCHDSEKYGSEGTLVNIGYGAVLAPFIPIWYLGEEWDNQTETPSGGLYRSKINYSLIATNRDYYESVKKFIRIRRTYSDIFEYTTDNHRETNICKVTATIDGSAADLQAYARYANNEAVIVVANNGTEAKKFTVTVPYSEAGLEAANYQITDLMNDCAITSGASTALNTFDVTVRAGEVGVYLVEQYAEFDTKVVNDNADNYAIKLTTSSNILVTESVNYWSQHLQQIASGATDEHNALAKLLRENILINGMSIEEAFKKTNNASDVDTTRIYTYQSGEKYVLMIEVKKSDNPYHMDFKPYFTLEIKDGITLNGYQIKAQKYYVDYNSNHPTWTSSFNAVASPVNITSAEYSGGNIILTADRYIEGLDTSSAANSISIDGTALSSETVTATGNKLFIPYTASNATFTLATDSALKLGDAYVMPVRYTFTFNQAATTYTNGTATVEDAVTAIYANVSTTSSFCSTSGHSDLGDLMVLNIPLSSALDFSLANYYQRHLQVSDVANTVNTSISINDRTIESYLNDSTVTNKHTAIHVVYTTNSSGTPCLQIAIPKNNGFGFDAYSDFTVNIKEMALGGKTIAPVTVTYTAEKYVVTQPQIVPTRLKKTSEGSTPCVYIYFDGTAFANTTGNNIAQKRDLSNAYTSQLSQNICRYIMINGETIFEVNARSGGEWGVQVTVGQSGSNGYIKLKLDQDKTALDNLSDSFTVEFVEGFVLDGYSIPRTVCTTDGKISKGFWVEQGSFTKGTVVPRRAAGDWSTKDNILEAGSEFYGEVKPEENYQLKAGSLSYSYVYKGEKVEIPLLETSDGYKYYYNISNVVGKLNAKFVDKTAGVNFATVGATSRSGETKDAIRFVTRMYLDNIDLDKGTVTIGEATYDIVDYGTLVGIAGADITVDSATKIECEPEVYRNVKDVFVDFTAELVNVDTENADTEFAARGYFTYKNSDGEAETVYTGQITRTLNGVNN